MLKSLTCNIVFKGSEKKNGNFIFNEIVKKGGGEGVEILQY